MTRSTPTSLEICVDIDSRTIRAGRATFARRGGRLLTSFSYDPDYLSDLSGYDVDPALPRYAGPFAVEGLPGAFDDLAPDSWGRNLISRRMTALAREAGLERPIVGDVDFLVGVNDVTRQGALRFREPNGPFLGQDADIPKTIDLPALLTASDQVVISRSDDDQGQAAIKVLLAAGSATLGGARPKASVIDGDILYIAKFPHPVHDRWDVMAWEKTALDLAERAGIPVPARRLDHVEGRSVLLVARFDRESVVGGTRRVGYVSASTLIGGPRSATRDYLDLQAAMEDHSAAPDDDLVDMWRRIAFSVAIHNTDDHLRNHGFVHTRAGWRLSPAFDINPNPDLGEPRSTPIYGETLRSREVEALMAASPYFGLSDAGARAVLAGVFEATEAWREVAAANGISEPEIAAFEATFDGLRP